jgi:UDP-N-acetylglucosamine--N-acetylmuramyl-(pentapeptide) pyrophosphoryl-undecaprenol N-acetylglucosamine transferase
MVLAARLRRIPAALTEADAHLGLANRLAAPLAQVVFLAFRWTASRDRSTASSAARSRALAAWAPAARRRRRSGSRGRPVVLVFGGSQGAALLNEAVYAAFAESGPAVLHLAGDRDFPELERRPRRDDYRLLPFTDEFGAALAAADLVVARAGGSVWEVAAAGSALLVPYPHATADHQAKNARYFRRGGGSRRSRELDLRRQVDGSSATRSGWRRWERRCSAGDALPTSWRRVDGACRA